MSDKAGKSAPKPNANGTKKAVPAEQTLEQEIPKDAACLMDCEAAEIMAAIQDKMAFLSQDPNIILPEAFDTGLAYAKRGGNSVKPETTRRFLEERLKKYGVSGCEICLIANISPESADEVFALIPSLKAKQHLISHELRFALDELANLKQAYTSLQGET